jgi:transposase
MHGLGDGVRKWSFGRNHLRKEDQKMNATTYGLDIAKRVFQMYWVDGDTGEIVNRRFNREDLIAFLAQRPAGHVALEACGSGHWWARKIESLGHTAILLHAKFIRPFVQTNKTDAADARAIWVAAKQPGMRTVAAKTPDQQAMLSLHRMRSLLVKFRTMQVNQMRGLLYEFGVTLRTGRLAGMSEIRKRMANLEAEPGMLWGALQDQVKRVDELDKDIERIEKQMTVWQKQEVALSRNCRNSWHWEIDGYSAGRHHWGCHHVQVRTGVCGVSGMTVPRN